MNIIMNTKYNIKKLKNESIEFTMVNSQREYKFSNKDVNYIDYDLVDRVLHSVPIETQKY
jgi:protein associated with RNAse G/E